MLQEHTLDTAAGKLNFARGMTAGPPLLLFHGVTRCWQDWSPVLPHLNMHCQVQALDFRGHGKSQRTPGQYRVMDYVDDARALVRQCTEPPVVFGHSLGAMVALAVAADPQLNIRAAILEDPPFETTGSRLKETAFFSFFQGMQRIVGEEHDVATMTRALADLQIAAPDSAPSTRLGDVRDEVSLRFSARCLQQVDPDVFTPIVAGEWLAGYRFEEMSPNVRCPLLLLQADINAGGMLTNDDAALVESSVAECYRLRFPGAGHLLHWMETEKLLRTVLGFLASV